MEKEPQRNLVEEKLQSMGIKAALIDFDNTLITSYTVWESGMMDYAKVLASRSGEDEDEVFRFMADTLKGLRNEYYVNPIVMSEPARISALRYGQDITSEDIVLAQDRLMDLYTPDADYEVIEGSEEGIKYLMSVGLDTYLATHAGRDFTLGRVKAVGLNGFFKKIYPMDNMQLKDMWA